MGQDQQGDREHCPRTEAEGLGFSRVGQAGLIGVTGQSLVPSLGHPWDLCQAHTQGESGY